MYLVEHPVVSCRQKCLEMLTDKKPQTCVCYQMLKKGI